MKGIVEVLSFGKLLEISSLLAATIGFWEQTCAGPSARMGDSCYPS